MVLPGIEALFGVEQGLISREFPPVAAKALVYMLIVRFDTPGMS